MYALFVKKFSSQNVQNITEPKLLLVQVCFIFMRIVFLNSVNYLLGKCNNFKQILNISSNSIVNQIVYRKVDFVIVLFHT